MLLHCSPTLLRYWSVTLRNRQDYTKHYQQRVHESWCLLLFLRHQAASKRLRRGRAMLLFRSGSLIAVR